MTEPVGKTGNASVEVIGGSDGRPVPSSPAPIDVLPAPDMDIGAAKGDVMALMYALTAKQRDADGTQRASAADRKGTERQQAFDQMREEQQKAKDAKEDGGWLGSVTHVLDAAADAVVGGNPLQDVAHELCQATGTKTFDVAYDFIRPDALMHGAALLASAATGERAIAQGYDVGAGNSSLKTRFQGATDMTGCAWGMDAYAVTRDAMATLMVTVGTCGAGTVAYVAIASSAALMLEAKLDVLGKAGVGDNAKMWIRVGAQAYVVAGTAAASFVNGAKMVSGGAKAATHILSGANQIARGSVQIGQALYEHASSDHFNESAMYQNLQHQADREQERIIGGLREVSKSYQRSLETIASTMNERDQTPLLLARNIA